MGWIIEKNETYKASKFTNYGDKSTDKQRQIQRDFDHFDELRIQFWKILIIDCLKYLINAQVSLIPVSLAQNKRNEIFLQLMDTNEFNK